MEDNKLIKSWFDERNVSVKKLKRGRRIALKKSGRKDGVEPLPLE